jgi:tRNA modification GTPase
MNASTLADGRTIVAVSTPSGRGALAIVRVSGRETSAIAAALLSPVPTIARRVTRCTVRDAAGSLLDDAVATRYVAPHSFTGEDLLEITTHGGVLTPTLVMAAAVAAGARIAEPGEFTRRAVLNGKLDLVQAEAVGDLIDSRSLAAHTLAIRQLDGGLSRRIGELRQRLLELEAQLAYDIDFPEEDDGPLPRERIASTAQQLLAALNELLASGSQGVLVHDGALVVLAGAPNTGKSSLFNALLGESRAIVTEVPGTTRDAIEAVLDTPRWPLRLVDTAGLRETKDLVERLGIEVSSRYLARADVVLACTDTSDSAILVEELQRLTAAPIVTVRTKADLLPEGEQFDAEIAEIAEIAVSASTGKGLAALLHLIEDRLTNQHGVPALDAPVLTRARHRVAVTEATNELRSFMEAWTENALPSSVAATHIREAGRALSTLIGVVEIEEILDVVFRNFCVGK